MAASDSERDPPNEPTLRSKFSEESALGISDRAARDNSRIIGNSEVVEERSFIFVEDSTPESRSRTGPEWPQISPRGTPKRLKDMTDAVTRSPDFYLAAVTEEFLTIESGT